jgi:hypothetical protein
MAKRRKKQVTLGEIEETHVLDGWLVLAKFSKVEVPLRLCADEEGVLAWIMGGVLFPDLYAELKDQFGMEPEKAGEFLGIWGLEFRDGMPVGKHKVHSLSARRE